MKAKMTLGVFAGLKALLCLIAVLPAYSQTKLQKYWIDNYGTFNPPSTSTYGWSTVAKAQPDECFFGVGDQDNLGSFKANYPAGLSTGYDPCSFGERNGRPKVNQAYVWGLTKHGKNLWFGTVANTLCLVMEGMGATAPLQENTLVCEGGSKDVRPPRIFMYDTVHNTPLQI
jgi:hypothetical protein